MRIEGILSKWNNDRGFGFIAPMQGGQEIFVHISAFPKQGKCPQIGEKLTFEIEITGEGKKRARSLVRIDFPEPKMLKFSRQPKKRSSLGCVVLPIFILGLIATGYVKYFQRVNPQIAIAPQELVSTTTSPFRCDGRTHCSQMTSCAEATFFLKNCPNTQMDGNNDGVPCERQWCTNL
ncbi:cold shock domain-containing protein [Candidatus Electronema sp. JM]|uniref:cold shock domain-containing protein n=1 Tax=Candidatus Electronema sp. JM TaxID=3401571 RepID=UPI003AA83F54